MVEDVFGIAVGGPELCDELGTALRGQVTLTPARSLEVAIRIASRQAPALLILDELLLGARPHDELEQIRIVAPAFRAVVIATTTDPDRLALLTPLGPIVKHPIDVERLRVAVRSALRLSAMASGVRQMRQTGRFSIDPKEIEEAIAKAERAKGD